MNIRGKDYACTIELTLDILGGKWKMILLWGLMMNGPQRFGTLKRNCTGISSKVLTQQLKELEQDDLVLRKAYDEKIPRVEYSISEYGKTVLPIMKEMHDFSIGYIKRKGQAIPPCAYEK